MKPVQLWIAFGTALTLACDTAIGPNESLSGAPDVSVPEFAVVKTPIEETLVLNEPSCAGEILELHIRQQMLVHELVDPDGRTHTHLTFNDKGTTALGLTSGTIYHQVGTTVVTGNFTPTAPEEFTRVNIINLIGEGSAPKLFVEELFHVTVNANGVEVSFYDVSAIRCQT